VVQPSRVPKLVAGVGDLRSLPLAPVDGFILSRINGTLTADDIAVTCGLGADAVGASLDKLKSLGVIEWVGQVPTAPNPSPRPPPTTAAPVQPAKIPVESPRPPAPPRQEAAAPAPLYDPRELDEEVDLEMADRKRFLDLFYKLDDLDYYEILGVPHDADKKAIKRSYFQLASVLHPDKFFRKNLGSYKAKMEKIFGRVTEAHDTLTSKERRPEYDQYIELQAQARGIEAIMETARTEAKRAHQY
jgi:hypothetical protein